MTEFARHQICIMQVHYRPIYTPDAIQQRGAIFQYLKVNKTANERKLRTVDQITQNVIALLNI
jgi:hypothetical protein